MSRTVQTLQDAEVIINRLLNESDQLRKDLKTFTLEFRQDEEDEIKIERKFFDIANEVEFMRELNLVVHKLHHKFKRIVFEGESRWYDYDGRNPSQWFTQFAIIDGPNKSLFLRDESNQPIWEIVRRAGGVNMSNWLMYANLLPPKTNPLTSAGYFNVGGADFRWDQIYGRMLDLENDPLFGSILKAKLKDSSPNTVSLYVYDSNICGILFGTDAVGNTFTARSASAWVILKDSGGNLSIYGNSGLSSGSTFSPVLKWSFVGDEILPTGDKHLGNSTYRIANYSGKYMELDLPGGTVNTAFTAKVGGTNAVALNPLNATDCGISFGSVFVNPNWIAQSSTSAIIMKGSATLAVFMNYGLGVGGSFSPTMVWQWDGSGNFIPTSNQSIGNGSFRVGTIYAQTLNVSDAATTRSNLGAARNGSFTTNTGGADSHTHTIVLTST